MSAEDEPVSGTRGRAEDSAEFHPLDRFNAFSDGVFAIVITLLVLALPVPPENIPVLPALAKSWPEFLGYAISFAFVGGIWLSHAALTKYLKRGDAISFRLNLVLLLFVSLLPFSTHLMVLHVEGEGVREAVAVYGVNLFLASGMMTALMYYAAHDRYLVVDDLADDKLKRAFRRRRAYLVFGALIIVVGLVAPMIALGLYIALTFGFILQPLLGMRRKH
jgi:uncharacterized membrane protein